MRKRTMVWLVVGCALCAEAAETAAALGVPAEKSMLLQHMILSHHGDPEFGAAVLPQCAESELLSLIDRIDSRMEFYRETFEELQAEFERQLAPLREKQLNDEARELVRSGEFKSLDRAKEYLQLKQGMPVASQPAQTAQPRNEQGQYAPKEDPVISARIEFLGHQADVIKADTGLDVISVFETNEEIREAVKNGEMDFYDVAKQMQTQPSRRPPAPMRSPNGASGQNKNAITSMSDEQFERMERKIKEGGDFL